MRRLAFICAMAAGAAACAPHQRPIAYGDEACTHCHMPVVDPRFAGELVAASGRVYPFDDIGCLAAFVATGPVRGQDVHLILVNAFVTPDTMLDAASAMYLRSTALRTPMGSGLAALRPGREADSVQQALGGDLLSWREVASLPVTPMVAP